MLLRGKTRRPQRVAKVRLLLEQLESRELLATGLSGFVTGPLIQVSSVTPFVNPSDIVAQPGSTVYLNSEVEPRLAVDPNNPHHMVGVYQQDRWNDGGARGIVAAVTFTGGLFWTDIPLPGVTVNTGGDTLRASDPWVTIARDGSVYAVTLRTNHTVNNGSPKGMYVSKSVNGGLTWSQPVPVIVNDYDPNFFDDKESITADPTNARNVYVTWDRLNFAADTGPAMFSRTTDGGQTWSTPQAIYDTGAHGQTLGNQIIVLPNGVLVDVFERFNFVTGARDVALVRSTDQGITWSPPVVVASDMSSGVFDPHNGHGLRTSSGMPDVAVDRGSGALYVTWQDSRFAQAPGYDSIALSASHDGGLTWSSPIRVNQTAAANPADMQAFTQSVAVGANGTVAVTYYDFRNDPMPPLPAAADYWIVFANPSASTLTFGNEQRLTNTSFNVELAPDAFGYMIGDYEGLAAGGLNFNSFTAFFSQTVSAADPTSIFARVTINLADLGFGFGPLAAASSGQAAQPVAASAAGAVGSVAVSAATSSTADLTVAGAAQASTVSPEPSLVGAPAQGLADAVFTVLGDLNASL